MPLRRTLSDDMRVAINLLTEDPNNPSGAHFFWTHMIPEMAKLLTDDEEFHLVVSPKSRPLHEGYGPNVHNIMFPWSNERQWLRTLSEHVLTPSRLSRAGITVFNTMLAPLVKPTPGLVLHLKSLHAYTAPASVRPAPRMYRRLSYPHSARMADAIIINSDSLLREVQEYLDVDPAKLHLIREGVDHEMFRPGDRDAAWNVVTTKYGVTKPFVLFVSSLWPYKNAAGLLRAFAAARTELGDRQLVMVGPARDVPHTAELHALARQLGIADDIVWVGGVPLADTVHFYRSADVFVYPSFNETFGLPLLESMACGCPVVTSNATSNPETAGNGALIVDAGDPDALADAVLAACGPQAESLRARGFARAAEFSWASGAAETLAVYRDVHARRSGGARSS